MATNILDLGSSKVGKTKKSDTVDIFKIDDKVYSAPKKPGFGVMLKYMKAQAEKGPDVAVLLMIEEMMGEEAFEALSNHAGLTSEHFTDIVKRLEKIVLAQDEEGEGK